MADVSHFGGLIAAGVMKNPSTMGFHVMMTTNTQKPFRGPHWRSDFKQRTSTIPSKHHKKKRLKNYPNLIDRSVFLVSGVRCRSELAAIAVALHEADTDEFRGLIAESSQTIKSSLRHLSLVVYKACYWWNQQQYHRDGFLWAQTWTEKNQLTLDAIGISNFEINFLPRIQISIPTIGPPSRSPAMTTRGIREERCSSNRWLYRPRTQNADNEEVLKALREEVRTFVGDFR